MGQVFRGKPRRLLLHRVLCKVLSRVLWRSLAGCAQCSAKSGRGAVQSAVAKFGKGAAQGAHSAVQSAAAKSGRGAVLWRSLAQVLHRVCTVLSLRWQSRQRCLAKVRRLLCCRVLSRVRWRSLAKVLRRVLSKKLLRRLPKSSDFGFKIFQPQKFSLLL